MKILVKQWIWWDWRFLLFISICNFLVADGASALPPIIRIGAILESGDMEMYDALANIIDRVNNDKMILPRSKLQLITQFVRPRDSYRAAKSICEMVKNKTWLIFSSRSESVNWFARSLADKLHIPHISVYWDYRAPYIDDINQPKLSGSLLFNGDDLKLPSENNIIIRPGPNGGFYQDSNNNNGNKYIGNAETGFRYQEQPYIPPPESFNIKHFTLNLYPETAQLGEALVELVDSRNWKSFTVIYDSHESLIKCKDIFTIPNRIKPGRPQIKMNVLNIEEFEQIARMQTSVVLNLRKRRNQSMTNIGRKKNRLSKKQNLKKRKLRTENVSNEQYDSVYDKEIPQYVYLRLLKEIKKSEHNFVLSMKKTRIIELLREAQKMRRLTEYDNYLIITLDLHTFNLKEFQSLDPLPNITSLSILSAEGQGIDLGDQKYRPSHLRHRQSSPSPFFEQINKKLTTTEALIYDAVTLFARALDDLDRAKPEVIVEPFVQCDQAKKWPFGPYIISYMKQMSIKGMTGLLLFDDRGLRVNFTLDVQQLQAVGLKTIAIWTRESGMKSSANFTFLDSYKQILEIMKYKDLRVVIPPSVIPYIALKENHESFVGNDKYYGFCVDLLEEIQQVFREVFQSDFRYTIYMNSEYGSYNKETGDWGGVWGELIRHQADLAIADLTATYLRETVVDFTMPFMNLGITILFKKPGAPEPEMFSFLKPLSVEVWLYLASAFLGIALWMWILARVSPYEWVSPHSCDPEPLELENQFSIGSALWFTIGSLMQQGSDIAPRALSTRTLASVWWFFALIMISSYTANLAASLTLSRMAPEISNADDLAKQTSISYGCRYGGSTWEFFQNSNHSTYQRMFNTMESNSEVYIKKIVDAIERVRKGGYAYLAESSTIEYLIERKCDLIQVGNWLDNKGYGIATPPDSPYRTPLSNAIIVLQDRGRLYQLKERWWVEKGGGLCREDPSKMASASELNIENVGGVFLVLAMGVGIGCISGILEFIWKSLKVARDERESICMLIWFEVVRICTGGGSSRPVYQTSSQSRSNVNAEELALADDDDGLQTMTNTISGNNQRPAYNSLKPSSSYNSVSNSNPIYGTALSNSTSPDYGNYRAYPNFGNGSSNNGVPYNEDIMAPLLKPVKSLSTSNDRAALNNPVASPLSFNSQPPYY